MPTYEYRCTRCDHRFDQTQKVGEAPPPCPECGAPTRKVFSSVGLIFKGSGFHTTDYRKPAPSDGDAPKPSEEPGKKGAAEPATEGPSKSAREEPSKAVKEGPADPARRTADTPSPSTSHASKKD